MCSGEKEGLLLTTLRRDARPGHLSSCFVMLSRRGHCAESEVIAESIVCRPVWSASLAAQFRVLFRTGTFSANAPVRSWTLDYLETSDLVQAARPIIYSAQQAMSVFYQEAAATAARARDPVLFTRRAGYLCWVPGFTTASISAFWVST
jgi:hypothetical protein